MSPPGPATRAGPRFWSGLALAFLLDAAAIGLVWDRRWHAGAYARRYFWNTMASPTRRSVLVTVMRFGIAVPAITGVAGLYLRLHTPEAV